MMIESRSRIGCLSAVNTRSRSTGEWLCEIGTVGARPCGAVSGAASGVPGSHCTNFSPIRLAGRIEQLALPRKGAKPGTIRISMRALRSFVSATLVTWPTRAPATFTSWPEIRKSALSKIASTR